MTSGTWVTRIIRVTWVSRMIKGDFGDYAALGNLDELVTSVTWVTKVTGMTWVMW